jgi:carboxyl-terminal processing protease
MEDKTRKRDQIAWSAITVVAVLCAALIVNVPSAYAQDGQSDTQRYFNLFQSAFNFILQSYVDEVDPQTLYEGAMQGLFDSLGDPYSSFLTEAMVNDLNDTTMGQFGGIGLYINKPLPDPKSPDKRSYVEIVSPIEDTPGWRAGIQPGDQITHINGEPTEPLVMDEVLKRLRGEPGSTVTITILRGASVVFDEKIVRAMIEVPTVKRAMLPDGSGYLRIIEFTPQTVARVRESLDWFKANKYQGLVIDLRNNPGGLLQSVIQVADLFLSEGIIVSTKSRTRSENAVYRARSDAADAIVPKDLPLIVLINRGSASASEILAGALKDNKRAYLIGENSYGKGSVQQVLSLGDTGFKLTMSRYYTPSDANIDKVGIAPDLEIKEPELSPAEEESLNNLMSRNVFEQFALTNPSATPAQVDMFVRGLRSAGSPLSERVLKRLVRNQLLRTSIAPEYDLEYDLQLKAAIEVLAGGQFATLVASSMSVHDLQATVTSAAGN